jgi:hypothetical protein
MLILLIGLVLFVSGCTQTTGQTTGSQNTASSQQNCRQVQVPYYEQECNSVPYTDQECDNIALIYTKSNFKCRYEGLFSDWSNVECTITNLDTQAGIFYVDIGVKVKGTEIGERQSSYIYPQQSKTYSYKLQAHGDSCYCNEVDIPTKQVCRDVIKTRQECKTVTKYRTEQQCA